MHEVETFLQTHHIDYVLHEHPAVFTCADAEKYCVEVPGIAGKNLFLRDKKGLRYFLIILPATKKADLKKICALVGEPKITFASAEALQEKLGVEPGSVSPFGLLNDTKKEVMVYIDKEIHDAPLVNFHPNRNTASLELSQEMFRLFFEAIGNKVEMIEV